MIDQLRWDFVRQQRGVFVVLRHPVEDLVELQEDAGLAVLVAVSPLAGALSERVEVDLARLTRFRLLVSAVNGLAAVGFEC